MTGDPLWVPDARRIERANVTRFARAVGVKGGYDALWRWSVDEIESFWGEIWDYYGVAPDASFAAVLGDRAMPGAEWFPGARLNYAERIFRTKRDNALAFQHVSELRGLEEWTWHDLRRETARVRAGLIDRGVGRGDRVVAYMPNIPETVAAFLAVASLGAIWSSAAPEFGTRSVVDRFAQIEPKVLLVVDGYRYGGKDIDRLDAVAAIADALPTVEHVVRHGYADGSGWDDGFGPRAAAAPPPLEFDAVPFDHPLWVLYSSGSTGPPKPIVHGHGGILLEHLKTAHLHLDAQPGDRLFWFTTTGWMMWNLLVGVLLTDASIVLFDGSPGHPGLGRLWDLAEETGMTTFGTSAAFIASCMKAGIDPGEGRELSSLRAIGSTGSPLAPEGFDWVYDKLGPDVWLYSTSGGTDLCTAFVGGVPTLPVFRGELQARALGADVQAWDESGHSVVGQVGELVLTQPMPSMPLGFWGDDDGSRYRESYFEPYAGVWRHGDWIELSERGTAVIHGRSDATINRGGIRMGTSEIYRAVLSVEAVVDALVVDIPRSDAENWMPLFVVLRPGTRLDDDLRRAIAHAVRSDCSPRHVPDDVRQVDEIPRTLSGKALEVPVKRILMGTAPGSAASIGSLANPAALEPFAELAEELSATGPPR